MSNYKAITGSSKIVHRNQGGGSKLQGIPSTTNLNTWAHVAFRNRNVVCPCNRNLIFCMNQLGGVGAGGIPGRSYAFAPGADGTHKQFYCGHPFGFKYGNNKHIIYPKKDKDGFTVIAKYPEEKIKFKIIFSDVSNPVANTCSFYTNTKIQKGTTYKLKGTGIDTVIFRVEGLNENLTNKIDIYNVFFTDPNINSGNQYNYNKDKKDKNFELSVKN